jgi:hypothetical protein
VAKLQRSVPVDAADIWRRRCNNKVDLSYDRLLFYERYKTIAPVEKSVFEIPFLLEKVKQDMPDSEAKKIEVITQPGVPLVRADLSQLWFCVESVLAYLLRFVPESGKISVNISPRSGGVALLIRGYAPRYRWLDHRLCNDPLGDTRDHRNGLAHGDYQELRRREPFGAFSPTTA